MKIPLEFYNQIRDAVRVSDIVRQRIVLTRKGSEYSGICPFHSEKTPSFTVNDAKKFYHCFGCSAHGDVIRFVSEVNGISYKEAAVKIAGDNGIDLPKMSAEQEKRYEESDHIYQILSLASQFFVDNLDINSKNYLKERGLSQDIIQKFSIGYAPSGGELEKFFEKKGIPLKDLLKAGLVGRKEDGRIYEIFNKRIMFPIKNIYNKIVGFGGRALGDNMPKYINSPETMVFKKGEVMYGENIATGHVYKSNYSIIVEGYMDVIALHQAGFNQAVASLGTSVTDKHIQKLWRSGDEIIACLDGDSAGIRASKRLVEMSLPCISTNKLISFVRLPKGLDPDDLIKKDGPSAFDKAIKKRIGLSEMIWQNEYSAKNFKTAESKAILEQKLNEYCNSIEDKSLRDNFRRYFKEMVWNNLVRKKSTKQKQEVISNELIFAKDYSELEVIEHSICTFMVEHPEIINNIESIEILSNLEFKNKKLNEFKAYILDILDQIEEISNKSIEDKIKNTSFYSTYLVLLSPDILFLDLAFLKKNSIDLDKVFDWLHKKHYLLSLKEECFKLSKDDKNNFQSKSILYIQEIQKISKELSLLSDNFIDN